MSLPHMPPPPSGSSYISSHLTLTPDRPPSYITPQRLCSGNRLHPLLPPAQSLILDKCSLSNSAPIEPRRQFCKSPALHHLSAPPAPPLLPATAGHVSFIEKWTATSGFSCLDSSVAKWRAHSLARCSIGKRVGRASTVDIMLAHLADRRQQIDQEGCC